MRGYWLYRSPTNHCLDQPGKKLGVVLICLIVVVGVLLGVCLFVERCNPDSRSSATFNTRQRKRNIHSIHGITFSLPNVAAFFAFCALLYLIIGRITHSSRLSVLDLVATRKAIKINTIMDQRPRISSSGFSLVLSKNAKYIHQMKIGHPQKG